MAAGISDPLNKSFLAIGAALVGTANLPLAPAMGNVFSRSETYWHRQNVAAITAGTQIQFFNAAKSEFVTNFPQPGYIPGNHAMWLQSLAFTIEQGYQVDGTAEATGDPYQAALTASQAAGDLHILLTQGLVTLKVGTRTLIETYGLYHFPQGGGTAGFAGNYGTAAAVGLGVVTNGTPDSRNRFFFVPPHPIYPNEQISLTIKYPFARTLADAYVIKAELFGNVVSVN